MGDSEEESELEELQKKNKRVFFCRFRKVKGKLLLRNSTSRLKGASANSGNLVRRGSSGERCYFCLKQPLTSVSGVESQTNDPNSKSFSYDMMKSLIGKNEFYSKECNPHL